MKKGKEKDKKIKEKEKEKEKEKIEEKKEEIKLPELIKPPIINDAIFERAVYIMPYKSTEFIVKLQNEINSINLEALNIQDGNLRSLTTHSFSEIERNNKDLNFIGGFEIIDNESRIYVLEGLAEKAMKRLNFYFFSLKIIFFLIIQKNN